MKKLKLTLMLGGILWISLLPSYADMPTIHGTIEFKDNVTATVFYNYIVGKSTGVTDKVALKEKEIVKDDTLKTVNFVLQYPKTKLGDRKEIADLIRGYIDNTDIKAMRVYIHTCTHNINSTIPCKMDEVISKGELTNATP